jgi:hypothetical protein
MENCIGFTGIRVRVNIFWIMDDSARTIFAGYPHGVILSGCVQVTREYKRWCSNTSHHFCKNHYPFSALVRDWRYKVERQSVKSVILNSVGYDASTKILEIEFQTGLVYQYSGVPQKVYEDLMHSNEMGKYFSEKIRPRFHTKQVVA